MLVPGLTPSRPTDASAFKLLAVLFFSLITASVRSVTLVRFMGLGRIACCEEVASSVIPVVLDLEGLCASEVVRKRLFLVPTVLAF